MEYEIRTTIDTEGNPQPLINDKGQVQVRMTIDGKTLDQDFDINNLDENVKQGMAVFRAELSDAPAKVDTSPLDALIGVSQKVLVKDLPTIPEDDFEPGQPIDTGDAEDPVAEES